MSGDRLAQIKALPVVSDRSAAEPWVLITKAQRDALVEIAKAARALQADSFGDAPAWEALDAALARLDSEATEEDA